MFGIAQCRINAGIGYADDHVGLNGMLKGKKGACPQSGSVTPLPSMTESGRAK